MILLCFTKGVDVFPGSPKVGNRFRGDGLVISCVVDFPQNVELTNDPSNKLRNRRAERRVTQCKLTPTELIILCSNQ